MEIMLKGILMLSILLATSSLGLGLYTHDLLMLSIGIFVVGWVFQFVGHFYEKKKAVENFEDIAISTGSDYRK